MHRVMQFLDAVASLGVQIEQDLRTRRFSEIKMDSPGSPGFKINRKHGAIRNIPHLAQ